MPGFIKRSSLWEWADKRRAENILRKLEKGAPMPDAAQLNEKLIDAVKDSRPETVKALVKAGAGPNALLFYTYGGTESYPAITLAVHQGDARMVKALAEAGADLDKKDSLTGHTALIEAVRLGKTPMVRLLLDLGAGLDVRTSIHSKENIEYITPATALEIARNRSYTAIEKMLQDEPARRAQAKVDAALAKQKAAQVAAAEEERLKQLATEAAQALAAKDPSVTQTGQDIEVSKPLQIKRAKGLFR